MCAIWLEWSDAQGGHQAGELEGHLLQDNRSLDQRILTASRALLTFDLLGSNVSIRFDPEGELRAILGSATHVEWLAAVGIAGTAVDFDVDAPQLIRDADLVSGHAQKRIGGRGGEAQPNIKVLTNAAGIAPCRVSWLWLGLIPLGKVTVLDGRPGVGKSCVSLDLTARVTTGRAMPGATEPTIEMSNVIVLTAEDDWADTVVPRLMAAEADLSRVFKLDDCLIPEGQSLLEDAIREVNAKLVIIDPLTAFVGRGHDLYVDQHARLVLKPLGAITERNGAAVLVLRHLKKGHGQSAQDRGTGSIAIGGAARSNLIAAADPDIEGRFALAPIKVNVAKRPPTLGYQIESRTVDLPDGPAEVPIVRWGASVRLTADDLVAEGGQGAAARAPVTASSSAPRLPAAPVRLR